MTVGFHLQDGASWGARVHCHPMGLMTGRVAQTQAQEQVTSSQDKHLERHDAHEPKVEIGEAGRRGRPTEESPQEHARGKGLAGWSAEQVAAVGVGMEHALLQHLRESCLCVRASRQAGKLSVAQIVSQTSGEFASSSCHVQTSQVKSSLEFPSRHVSSRFKSNQSSRGTRLRDCETVA
jgi:hypothetical protein